MSGSEKKSKQKFKIKTWYSNRYQIVLVQRNILLLFALLSVISMSIAIIFVKFIVSSKSLEPYVIELESKTGVATIVDQMTSQNFTGDQVIREYFLNQFIQSAVAYDPRTYKLDIEKVRLFSSPSVYNSVRILINYKDLGIDSRIEVRIKSIQYPDQSTALVRISRLINMKGSEPVTKDELLTINFSFTDVNLTKEERLYNPLGFQVSSFLIAEEKFTY